MIKICRENREIIEQEYLSLLLNKSELIEFVTLSANEFSKKNNQRIFKYIVENYNLNKDFSMSSLPGDLLDYAVELLDGWYDSSSSLNSLQANEKAIERFYKEDLIIELNKKLDLKQIDYGKYIEEIKILDETTTLIKNDPLTRKEIEDNLTLNKIGIKFNNFKKLSNELNLLENDLLVVGATTGVGKSGFLLNLMNDLMDRYQCIYFNLEMSKSNIYRRLIAINQKFAVYSIDNPSDNQKNLINRAIENIEKNKVIVKHSINNVLDIKKVIKQVKDKKKHTVIFIDHIGLLKFQNKKSIYEESTEIVKELRKICLEYNCTIIAASQLNRSAYTSNEITLNMLKDSGELENSSRKIILLSYEDKKQKDNLEPVMIVDIAKNDNGSTGLIRMKYWKVRQVFEEITY